MKDVLPAHTVSAPMREFLTWVDRRARSYDDAMAAWQSHCPRYTVWEDALGEGLVEILGGCGDSVGGARIQLTPRGRSLLPSA